jgi:hypothetical protein
MPLSTLSADYLLDQWGTNKALFGSLHTAYSASGANEVTGGSPAYARQALTWASAAANSKALSGTYTWNVPASTTVYWVGFWDAVTSGNFQGMAPAGNASAFTFTALSSTSILTAPGSSFTSNQQVVIAPTGGSTTPGGLVVGTVYFVKSPSSDTFQLSATTGPGSAVTISSDGSGIIQAITPEAFGSQGTFLLSAGTASQV